tara:strand:+ start:116 stop:634 length:519 start_codon:yes stop_codon:yes gene_type:complete
MKFYLNQYITLISFLLMPIVIFWNPPWLSLMGYQAYWPIFWLLPWALIHGPIKSMLLGFFLGFILDTIHADLFTQIPGLMICGFWFGKVGSLNQFNNSPLQFGLTSAIGSLICSGTYFFQIVIKLLLENSPLWLFSYGVQNIFAQVFLTSLLAPVFCKWLYCLFSKKYKLKI